MKSKDYFYALIAISALGIIGHTFELFNNFVSKILIAGGISLLAVFYLIEFKNAREEYKKKKSYKFWKHFSLVSCDEAPEKKYETTKNYGSSYAYIPPAGVSSEKFKSKKLELKEFIKADDIVIKYSKGDIIIDVYHKKNADINHLE